MALAMPLSKLPEIDFNHKLGKSDPPHTEVTQLPVVHEFYSMNDSTTYTKMT